MSKSAIIIGGGVAGCVAALTMSDININCTIYELRSSPSTIGGSVNLTPNALRLLSNLGVHIPGCTVDAIEIFSYASGSKIGELSFRESGHALRVERAVLLRGLLQAVRKAGVKVVYGCKLEAVQDLVEDGKVRARFENEVEVEGDFLVGCDGIYSAVRLRYVEPEREPIYTGVCVAYAILERSTVDKDIHFQQTAMNAGQHGGLLTSFTDDERTRIYVGAVMQIDAQGSREGWKARGKEQEMTAREVKRRYGESAIPCLREMVDLVKEWIFYPVCKLEPRGRWSRGRVILLGDAAHGMPPQGESTGLAIEDAVLLGRVLEKLPEEPVTSAFERYTATRRPRIDAAYLEAVARWDGAKDKTWLRWKLEEWLIWLYMWYKAGTFHKSFSYDVTREIIE